jgi:hypothetical protein
MGFEDVVGSFAEFEGEVD